MTTDSSPPAERFSYARFVHRPRTSLGARRGLRDFSSLRSPRMLSFRITLLAPKNLDLREDHLLAGSALHREGFQDQRLNSQKLLVKFQLASLRRHHPPKQMQPVSPD